MIVADTSALISLALADSLDLFLQEFDVHTTETVVQELEDTKAYDDPHGDAAAEVIDRRDRVTVHDIRSEKFSSSRVDPGEGTCAILTNEVDSEFLITDDLRALPELQTVADAKAAISPIVLKALVQKSVLTDREARERVEQLVESRSWLETPIYRRAQNLFDAK